MKALEIDSLRRVLYGDGIQVLCPLKQETELDDFIGCDSDCAWFGEKRVSDKGLMGAFCGEKFIGNLSDKTEGNLDADNGSVSP